ncbi:RidA family protein [Kordiimonas pumila]|uniref:RidA family protein n=1 Tax=Kordiimonas pumila TaxID=2161677 RepID=A0ABV7D7D4_9PROT|nr:RidA family protein [Kordiimonas pumila]
MKETITSLAAAKGYTLPKVHYANTDFILYRVTGNLVYISGMVAQFEGKRPYIGKLGKDISLEDGIEAAKLSALNILSWLREAVGDDASRIASCLKLGGFVASTPSFTDQSKVISGASRLIVDVFGEKGKHTRTSVGVAVLPFDISVEIEAIFELHPKEDTPTKF